MVVVVVVSRGEKVLGGGTKAAAMKGDESTSRLPTVAHTKPVRTSTRPTATTAATDADAARMTEFIVDVAAMGDLW